MTRKRQKFPSSRRDKRRKRYLSRAILVAVFLSSLVLGASFLSRAEFLSLKEIAVEGAETLSEEKIKSIVEQETGKSFLKIFSRSNIFLYPAKNIKANILSNHKIISEADVVLKSFSGLRVIIKERKALALWCAEEGQETPEELAETKDRDLIMPAIESLKITENCFYLDNTGYAFASVQRNEDVQAFTKYFESNIKPGEISGKFILDTKDFQKLNKFLTEVGTLSITAQEVFLDYPQGQIVFEENFKLIVDLNHDMEKTFENLVTLISEPEFQREEHFSSVFEHIDLSFGNKVLYKLK